MTGRDGGSAEGGGVVGDWPPQHFRCMSEALRLNQIFACLPPTALPPNYLSLPSVPLCFFSLAVSISHSLSPAPMDNRVILLYWELECGCLCCEVWPLKLSDWKLQRTRVELYALWNWPLLSVMLGLIESGVKQRCMFCKNTEYCPILDGESNIVT